jgi:predicted transcriptional regulator of viral defense system
MSSIREYGIIPISTDMVADVIGEYRSPADRISRLARRGDLIRLQRGLFVVAPELSGQTLSRELIANHLYGPSYVSFESALSYHGIIPERVHMVRSATFRRSRQVETPLGVFQYTTVPENYYPIGITQMLYEEENYSFLMATPEKAICDLIIITSGLRIQSERAMREYLYEDMRMDFDDLEHIDIGIIEQCIEHGRKRRELRYLLNVLQNE